VWLAPACTAARTRQDHFGASAAWTATASMNEVCSRQRRPLLCCVKFYEAQTPPSPSASSWRECSGNTSYNNTTHETRHTKHNIANWRRAHAHGHCPLPIVSCPGACAYIHVCVCIYDICIVRNIPTCYQEKFENCADRHTHTRFAICIQHAICQIRHMGRFPQYTQEGRSSF
jgi:hypothetical protein